MPSSASKRIVELVAQIVVENRPEELIGLIKELRELLGWEIKRIESRLAKGAKHSG